ncbi:GNAT family N-acetyltransferase [Specibacter sp. NPDC057265]|uniref:GNAT family N-acetyltransferase n=1 Tax=Specibacter sp. NPDC057265 TaxID=3346075 RepID=UPI003624DAD9
MSATAAPESEPYNASVRMGRNDAKHRYELFVVDELAVIITFRDRPGHLDLIHTEAQSAFEGQGLATVLVRYALDDLVAAGKRVIPHCAFVADFIKEHPDAYLQHTDFPESG